MKRIVLGLLLGTCFTAAGYQVSALDSMAGWYQRVASQFMPGDRLDGQLGELRAQIETSLTNLRERRAEIRIVRGPLEEQLNNNETRRDAANTAAAECRAIFQNAEHAGTWPVEYRRAAYTREQFVKQVEVLLADVEVTTSLDAKFREGLEQLDQAERNCAKRILETAAELELFETRRQVALLNAAGNDVDDAVAELVAIVDANGRVLEGNPVRDPEELLATTPAKPVAETTQARALSFLEAASEPTAAEATVNAPGERREADHSPTEVPSQRPVPAANIPVTIQIQVQREAVAIPGGNPPENSSSRACPPAATVNPVEPHEIPVSDATRENLSKSLDIR